MALKEHIEDIRDNLKKGMFENEAAVSQGVVLRLLGVLGWQTFNTQMVTPEYTVSGRRVDFALCDTSSKPLVFIEVKQVGNIEGAERQLFEYAFHEGVPIAILTDGQKWQFFHPTGQGDYKERKVHELDLIEEHDEEIICRLNRYLNYESVRTGEAIEAIKTDYETVRQQRQIEARLPGVWSGLVQEKNEDLLLIVMDAAKNKIGYEPTEEQILDFLEGLERKTEPESLHPLPISPVQPKLRRGHKTRNAPRTRLRVTMPDGNVIEHSKAIDTWLEIIRNLGPHQVLEVDPEGQVISTSPNFRSGRPEVQHGRYYIAKDYSTKDKKRLLEKLASRLGIQMKVEIVDKS